MVKVDAKGRVVLPQRLRDRLGIDPHSEVEIYEDDGRVVVEPEDKPGDIVEDLERLIDAAAAERSRPSDDDLDPQAQDHVDAIRRQVGEADR